MPPRTDRDLVALTVLALLLSSPRHPYQLHRLIVDTHKDFVTGLPRSLYHAIDRLAHDELIEPAETQRDGKRPERTVYRITSEGQAQLRSRLTRMLEQPQSDSATFVAALSFLACLTPDEVDRSLHTRAAILEGRVAAADAQLGGTLPRILLLELEYQRAADAAELAWVRGIRADLAAGVITWSPDKLGMAVPFPEVDQEADEQT